ncbi:hypothetical protein HY412_00210 [Candidatus Kaiserbacteria bacterium]|nr:hypothetical protein [Candidatus Kaiserbacteria bacterium]
MGQILRNWRISAATVFSVILIIGAYLLARNIGAPPFAEASAETALLKAIAARDSDADGLPDWEELLYGTDSRVTDTFKLGMTDGEAVKRGLIVPKAIANIPAASSSPLSLNEDGLPNAPGPGTLTAAFAENFFTLFVSAKAANGGGDLTESQMNDIANQALNSLASIVAPAPDYKSANDIKVIESSPESLKEFAVKAEAVFLNNTGTASKSEILYLQDAIEKNDDTAFQHIVSIAKMYRGAAVGLAVLPVPSELAADTLALINALMRVSAIASDFAKANTDPLATMLALRQYPDAVLALGNAFINIGKIYKDAGISLKEGEAGASFVNMIENIAAKQQADKKP